MKGTVEEQHRKEQEKTKLKIDFIYVAVVIILVIEISPFIFKLADFVGPLITNWILK